MKIGQLTSWLSNHGGGVSAVVRSLSLNLHEKENISDVSVFGLLDNIAQDLDSNWNGLNVDGFRPFDNGLWGYAPRLVNGLLHAELSLLHVHGLWQYSSVACLQWAKKTGNPYIISPHGMLDSWALSNAWLKKKIAAWAYENRHLKNAACLHALNNAEANAMRAYGLCNPITIIPNGVGLPSVEKLKPPSWRKRLPKEAKVLLFLGRIHPKKGLPTLLRAWKKAQSFTKKNSWYLIIAGWSQGGHEQDMKALAKNLKLDNNVLFIGPQFGYFKSASFQHADAFILPSFSEGLPMVVLESWAFGLPVLMTDECNIPEGFEKKAAIRLPLDTDGMVESIIGFIRLKPEDMLKIGMAGKKLVEEQFSWSKVATDMNDVYRWMLDGGSLPSTVDI